MINNAQDNTTEHTLINYSSSVPRCLRASHSDESISSDPPTLAEVHAAISRLKNGKAPGICNIPPELLKAAGLSGVEWLTAICAIVPVLGQQATSQTTGAGA